MSLQNGLNEETIAKIVGTERTVGAHINWSADYLEPGVIHYGGPVSSLQGFVLHSDDVKLENSTKVKDGIAMTSDIKMIEAIAAGKGPRQSLIMLGYVGWAPGQLEAEIKNNAWFVIPADKSLIFGRDAEKKWHQATDRRQTPL